MLRVAIRKQKMEITQVFDFPCSKVVTSDVHDKCSEHPQISKTDENADWVKDPALRNRRLLLVKLLNAGNFIWVNSKHCERQTKSRLQRIGFYTRTSHLLLLICLYMNFCGGRNKMIVLPNASYWSHLVLWWIQFFPELKMALKGRFNDITTIQAKSQEAPVQFQTVHFPECFEW